MAEQIAVSEDFNKAVDQVILDSKRLHGVVNGDGLASIVTEDGSLIPSVRKALLDNLYFKTPPIAWKQGTQVSVFNQLYAFTEAGATSWWYAPTATQSTIVLQGVSPKSDLSGEPSLTRLVKTLVRNMLQLIVLSSLGTHAHLNLQKVIHLIRSPQLRG